MDIMGKPDKIVDSLLVISYKAGDQKALDLLVRRWNHKLCAHAYSYLKDWSLAKDVTQDTWSAVLAKIHRLRDTNSFGSWAMTIVTRKALDVLKKQKNSKSAMAEQFWNEQQQVPDPPDTKTAKMERIKAVMAQLSLEHRMVLKLFYLEEYSLKEISSIVGVSMNTVKTRLFRARQKIKDELELNTRNHEKRS